MMRKIAYGCVGALLVFAACFYAWQHTSLRAGIDSALSVSIIRGTNTQATSSNEVPDTASCLSDSQEEGRRLEYVNGRWQSTIFVKNKRDGKVIWSKTFTTEEGATYGKGVSTNHCHFYMVREFGRIHNKDSYKDTLTANHSEEIWQYAYFDDNETKKRSMLTLWTNDIEHAYSGEFTVDPSDRYFSLVNGYMGKPYYSLVIKDISTGKDVYTLKLDDILKTHPNAAGTFNTGLWRQGPDGMYLVSPIDETDKENALIYIKRNTWETHIYDTPADYLHGVEGDYAPFEPYFAYADVPTWTGTEDGEQMLNDIATREGITKKHLIVANLKTGATTTIATVPLKIGQRFDPTWLDDNTLQYIMPDGTKKTYTVPH